MVQQTSLHDLIWFFVVSLMPSTDEEEEPTENADADKEKREKKDQEVSRLQPGEKKKHTVQSTHKNASLWFTQTG